MFAMFSQVKAPLAGRVLAAVVGISVSFAAQFAQAQTTPFAVAVEQAASRDADLRTFYAERDYASLWTSREDRARLDALLAAFGSAADHGLPAGRYDPVRIRSLMQSQLSDDQLGRLDVEISQLFLNYARDVQTGILDPSAIDDAIKRAVPLRSRISTITSFAQSNPGAFIWALPPRSPEYARLTLEKARLERLLASGGWGPAVPDVKLELGSTGSAVVALADRLEAMGFMNRSNSEVFDDDIQAGVLRFQQAHGLAMDGAVGPATREALNTPPERRLQSIIVAMERERWINRPRGERHIWVNIADFTAKIIDNDRVTFETRSVVGARDEDRVTPEFSDVMEFMVINPSWYVPRSIITKEYLPQLQENRYAVNHLILTDASGQQVNRSNVNFANYTESTFPFSMREPPSQGNALGLVKFMFPNRYNIYLHDTPAKNLFGRSVRAYSHGCVRLADPFDFAYTLLERQTSNPQAYFHSVLETGEETRVDIADPVPVHIDYRTAFTDPDGPMQYRADIYGRDVRIWNALAREGVVLRAVQG